MTISHRIDHYLKAHDVDYEVIHHTRTRSSVQNAIAAQIPLNSIAKAVVVKDQVNNYTMAVIPASRRLNMHQLEEITDSRLQLATEHDLARRFSECETGAIPPLGPAWGMETIWDSQLSQTGDLFFEAGDHENLLHVTQQDFIALMEDSQQEAISYTGPGKSTT
ncbi:aminoacyl-tRNA deacylase [Spongorhabdus nitratireducens]